MTSGPSPGGSVERRVVSVLFADLVGFTSLSEGLDAEEVSAVQDQYFAQVREVVGRYGGRLEKFIGDAAMAVFGVPRARDDDAERATRAGLALVRAVDGLAARIGLAEGALQLRVGVNTGEVAYAPAEDGQWRVSGDAVNTAARLQTAAEPSSVLIGDGTALAVAEVIAVDAPVELELKGKSGTVRAWRAVTPLPQRSRERAMGSLHAPLLGRETELGEIRQRLQRVRDGGTETLIVIAPPGVGKTRLVEELAAGAGQGPDGVPMPILRARLSPETISVAAAVTQLLVAALDPRLGSLPADDPDRQQARARLMAELLARNLPADRAAELTVEMATLLSETEQRDSAAPAPASELEAEREVRLRAWVEALDALAGAGPQIWLLEDLHWSGGDLLAFIEQAAARPAPRGRLILGTARPSLLELLGQRPAGPAVLPVLELRPLTAEGAGELVTALVGDALPPALATAIVERSDGTPLFIEELLRSWVSVGVLAMDDDGTWRLTAAPDEVPLPQTVQQIYAAQLDDLPDAARALVRRASVAGRNVPRDSLPTLDVVDAEPALEVTRRRALIVDGQPDVIYGPALSYRHALLRDAGYSSLARAERGRLHARLAAWYEQMAGARADEVAEQIANHYDAAIEHASRLSPEIDAGLDISRARGLAIAWYRRAAGRALAAAAHEAGRSFLRRALRHVDESATLERAGLLLALGEATAYTADMEEGGGLLKEAVELYRKAMDDADGTAAGAEARAGYAAAAAALGRVWIQQVRFDAAAQLANDALSSLGDGDGTDIAPLLGIRGWVQSTLTVDRSALVDIDRALDIARRAGDRRLELELSDWRAGALGEVDEFDIEDWVKIERLAIELGDWRRAVKAMRTQAASRVDDEHEQVWDLADRVEEIARRRGQEEDVCWIDYLRTEAGFVSGDWDRAMEAGQRVFDVGERNSYDRAVVRTLHALLPMASARGATDVVERAYHWHKARRHMFPDSPYARIMGATIDLHCVSAGLVAYFVPEVEPRLMAFEGEPGGPSWVAAIETVIESWLSAGEIAGTRSAVERMEAGVARMPSTSSLGRGATAYLRGRLLQAEDAPAAEIAGAADAALGHFRASRAPWWIAKALRLRMAAAGTDGQAPPDADPQAAAELADISRRLRLAGSA